MKAQATEAIAGIVLAAGGSRRMGHPKPLLPCYGEKMVHRAARVGLAARLQPMFVVVGAYAEATAEAVADLPVRLLSNPRWQTGQSTSVIAAAHALQTVAVQGAIFFLADQPFVSPDLVQALCATAQHSTHPIIAPQIGGHRSTPVFIRATLFPTLKTLRGDQGARALFGRFPPYLIPWEDVRAAVTVETPADYRRWCPEGEKTTWAAD